MLYDVWAKNFKALLTMNRLLNMLMTPHCWYQVSQMLT